MPELEQTFALLRLIFLIVAGSMGIYGVIILISILITYLVSFENYSTPILAPFSPLVKKDLKDTFYKGFLGDMEDRPKSLKNKNKKRIKFEE